MAGPIVAPVVALVCWTLVMQAWMLLTRLPAMRAKGIRLKGLRGGRGSRLDGVIPDRVQWIAHNYNHLLEQPTLFYATALSLAVLGAGGGLNLALGWAYVALRVAHSLVQAVGNVVRNRFWLFVASSLVLAVLAIRAAVVVLS